MFAIIYVDHSPQDGYVSGCDCLATFATRAEADAYVQSGKDQNVAAIKAYEKYIDWYVEYHVKSPDESLGYQEFKEFALEYYKHPHSENYFPSHVKKEGFKEILKKDLLAWTGSYAHNLSKHSSIFCPPPRRVNDCENWFIVEIN